jgi:cytochrome P450
MNFQFTLFLAEHTIPAGTIIILMPKEVQTDKDLWGQDAMEFKPERFLEENIKNIHPYAYFPFSNGPRVCPGLKYAQIGLKIFLSKFLVKYQVTTNLKYEELTFEMQVTLKISQGFTMKVERR